jgi:uncharacterized protein
VHGPGLYLSGFLAALVISTVASPAGVSGAVLLLPFQVSVLGTPSPAVTPTNLLYNVIATPGALYRYWRQGQTGGDLTTLLLAGTVPGVVAGSVVRVELLPGSHAFEIVIAVVLIPLGTWLASNVGPDGEAPWIALTATTIVAMAAVVGVVGGIYGIGGGSIIAPLLIGAGRSPRQVAPATLAATLVTSVVGVATFIVLSTSRHGSITPDWGIGVALGLGGLLGGYLGARAQPRLPDRVIRRTLGVLVVAIGARYAYLAAND